MKQSHLQLTLFTDPNLLSRLDRHVLTQFLQPMQLHLPPQAAALLVTSDFDEFCRGMAELFRSLETFGAPLREALLAIETLAQPENASLLEEVLSHAPEGWVNLHHFVSGGRRIVLGNFRSVGSVGAWSVRSSTQHGTRNTHSEFSVPPIHQSTNPSIQSHHSLTPTLQSPNSSRPKSKIEIRKSLRSTL